MRCASGDAGAAPLPTAAAASRSAATIRSRAFEITARRDVAAAASGKSIVVYTMPRLRSSCSTPWRVVTTV
jgi:hypothetical protein